MEAGEASEESCRFFSASNLSASPLPKMGGWYAGIGDRGERSEKAENGGEQMKEAGRIRVQDAHRALLDPNGALKNLTVDK